MKRSIKRLPKRTQEELAVLQELILQYLVNVRMIILYGSYARGEYVMFMLLSRMAKLFGVFA